MGAGGGSLQTEWKKGTKRSKGKDKQKEKQMSKRPRLLSPFLAALTAASL